MLTLLKDNSVNQLIIFSASSVFIRRSFGAQYLNL